MSDPRSLLIEELAGLEPEFDVCGVANRLGGIYPLGTDTKVLSTVFELISRPAVHAVAASVGCDVVEPTAQNHYPDFTLTKGSEDPAKLAIDVKTTYRRPGSDRFSYTLGGYTSFIRPGNERKNIVFPFSQYASHWVVGFVYTRADDEANRSKHRYTLKELDEIPLPFVDVEFFVNEKWKIASDRAGSGNTTNIGSIRGTIEDFREGAGPFESEEEFLAYWRSYGRTAQERTRFSSLDGFRQLQGR